MNDLFGQEIVEAAPMVAKAGQPKGYARPPGSGPQGETCKTCQHATAIFGNRTFFKCAVIRHRWTHGPGTDIRLKSPACELWTSKR